MTTVWVFVWYQGLLVGLVSSEFLSLVSIIKRESLLSEENRREENTQLRARSRHTQLAKHRAHRHTHIYIYILGYLTANTGTNVPSFDAQPGAGKKTSLHCSSQTVFVQLPLPDPDTSSSGPTSGLSSPPAGLSLRRNRLLVCSSYLFWKREEPAVADVSDVAIFFHFFRTRRSRFSLSSRQSEATDQRQRAR